MKRGLFLLLCGILSTQAKVIHFEISPAGSDAAVGLSPSNQVPVVTNSTGSGNTISGGITFDTDTMILDLAVGYGSAAGFSDLTGAPIGMHIHGPAAAGQNADVIVDLSPYNFAATNALNGGVIFGSIAFPADAVASLLGGSNYINIHTALNPGGEIRGQLVPASNSPPTITCPGPGSAECSVAAVVTAGVSDPDGDALTVVWTVNGSVVQTNTIPASNPPSTVNVSYVSVLPLGTNVVGITVTDSATNTTSCSTTVTVTDTTPPNIVSASAQPSVLWPPNHKLFNVTVSAHTADSCSSTTWKITDVTSNEAVDALGDGHTAPDWIITGDHTLKLRAERSGTSNGRTYTISLQATDSSGNVSGTKQVTVRVPKSQGK